MNIGKNILHSRLRKIFVRADFIKHAAKSTANIYKCPPISEMLKYPEPNVDEGKFLNGDYTLPPNIIPEPLYNEYTCCGRIPVLYWYLDERYFATAPVHNTEEDYQNVFILLDSGKFLYYGNEGEAFISAISKYPLKGKSVAIWGLAGCNCEAFSVWAGASQVHVIEYNKPICNHTKISVFNHDEYDSLALKTDFAISYSSFEHDGLGRYGDPLQPDGDLKAMEAVKKHLSDDGILFLGLPLGPDALIWNAHRIYGEIRLPLMLKGWQLLDVYCVYHEDSEKFPFDVQLGDYTKQCLMVLKKIRMDWPDDAYLLHQRTHSNDKKSSGAIFNLINALVLKHKSFL